MTTTGGESIMDENKVPELKIKNFVCSANLGMRFDLVNLVLKSHKKMEMVPKKNCVLMKLSTPKATGMLFSNGKIVCTGANTEENIKNAAKKFTNIIQKMDYPGVNLNDFKIQNVVGTCDLGFRILVEELAFAYSEKCTYEPELHPALIYRLTSPKVNILVFVSGKVVFTGTKHAKDLLTACKHIYPILREFKDTKHIVNTSDNNYKKKRKRPSVSGAGAGDQEDYEEEDQDKDQEEAELMED